MVVCSKCVFWIHGCEGLFPSLLARRVAWHFTAHQDTPKVVCPCPALVCQPLINHDMRGSLYSLNFSKMEWFGNVLVTKTNNTKISTGQYKLDAASLLLGLHVLTYLMKVSIDKHAQLVFCLHFARIRMLVTQMEFLLFSNKFCHFTQKHV